MGELYLKIESYEPYHIGIKFANFVNINNLKMKLMESLKEKKYDLIEEKMQIPYLIEKIKENIANKKKVRIELFYPVHAVNTIIDLTDSPKNIIESFCDIIDIVKKLDYDLGKTIEFFELVTNLVILTDKKPINIFNKVIKVDLGTFNDLGKINATGFKFRCEKNEKEFLELVFEPRLINPENRYFLRIVYRTKSIENLKKFHTDLESNSIKILNLIEGD
jgi:hypothetical protein